MTVLPFRRTLLACVMALLFQDVAAAEDPAPAKALQTPPRQVVRMDMVDEAGATDKLGYGNCQWLYPRDAPAKKLLAEPRYHSNKPIYYAARYGGGKDRVYSFVLDESQGPGKGYDTLYIDANHDNRIDAEKERFAIRVGDPGHTDPIRIRLEVTSGEVTAPYAVSASAFQYSDEKNVVPGIHVNLRNSSYYLGQAVFQGKTCKIAVADLDSNGLFNNVEQSLFHGDRFLIDLNDNGKFDYNQESFPYGGFTRIAGQWHSIVASPDGGRVTVEVAHPPLGKVEAPPRIAIARLNSPTQPLNLKFQEGSAEAVAGTYRVHFLQLQAEGEGPEAWSLSGTFSGKEPELTVREGQAARLEAGLPLSVEPQVTIDDDRTLRISLRITGAGGETYRWSPRDRSLSKAGFEIVDSSGKQITSGDFEYG